MDFVSVLDTLISISNISISLKFFNLLSYLKFSFKTKNITFMRIVVFKYQLHVALLMKTLNSLNNGVQSHTLCIALICFSLLSQLLIYFLLPNNRLKRLPMFSAMDRVLVFQYLQINTSYFMSPRNYTICVPNVRINSESAQAVIAERECEKEDEKTKRKMAVDRNEMIFILKTNEEESGRGEVCLLTFF